MELHPLDVVAAESTRWPNRISADKILHIDEYEILGQSHVIVVYAEDDKVTCACSDLECEC